MSSVAISDLVDLDQKSLLSMSRQLWPAELERWASPLLTVSVSAASIMFNPLFWK